MRFPCGVLAALLVVLALAVAVLCEKDGGSLVLSTVVTTQDTPRVGEAAETKAAANGTAEGEPTASSQKDVVRTGAENSSRTNVSNEETTIVPATSSKNAPSVAVTERPAQNSTSSENKSASTAVAVDTVTTLPQEASTAAAMAQSTDHKLPTAASKSQDESTPVPTVQNASSDATTQSGGGAQNFSQEDLPSHVVNDAAVTGSRGLSTTQKIVTSSVMPTVSTMAQSSIRPERATTLVGAEEVTTSQRTSSVQHGTSSNPTAVPKLTMTNISEGEEVSITVIPEQEEQEPKIELTSTQGRNAATLKLTESPVNVEREERLASASTTTTVRSQIFSYVNYTDEDDAVEITHEKSSVEQSNETEKPTNLETIDFHEYSTKETHQSILSPHPAASQTIQPEVPPTLGAQENVTLHSIPGLPVNLTGLNSSTSVVVSVSFADDDKEGFLAAKDNVSLPMLKLEPPLPSDLQNIVSNQSISSPEIGGNSTSAKSSNGSGHISVFRPSAPQHRKFSPPTRRTTAAPSGTTPNVVVAKHQHLGRAGLNLPTRKTTPGAPGSPTQKPHIGRGGYSRSVRHHR
ncbi:hypothetical protein MTO96_005552 [Rhipicephalus appendiculatus]